jgi:hypothetical protein
MRSLIVALVLAVGAATAFAQAPGEVVVEAPKPPAKRLRTAIALSWGAFVGPMVASAVVLGDAPGTAGAVGGIIASGAMVFGPSAGHCYAGRCLTTGLALRVAGAGIVTAMVVREQTEPLGFGTLFIGLGTAVSLWMTGLIWDAVTLPRAVRRANRERAFGIAPLVRGDTAGIALTGAL